MILLKKLQRYLKSIQRAPQVNDIVIIMGMILLLGFAASYFRQMNYIMAVAVSLLFGIIMGEVAQRLRVPKVTGYILAGILIGPSVMGLMSREIVGNVRVISEVTLGLIILMIGAEFELKHFIALGHKIFFISLMEVISTLLLVMVAMLAFGQPFHIALLIGAIATSTAPAATLMVIREYRSRGRLTDIILGVVALNNILCLVLFHIFFSFSKLTVASAAGPLELGAWLSYFYEPLWVLSGSLIFGIFIGYAINLWEQGAQSENEQFMVVLGGVLFAVGAATCFGLSPLLTTLAVGATLVNISAKGRKVLDVLKHADPPFYVAFFVISGAMLHIEMLAGIGMVGIAYIFFRVAGKVVGSYFGSRFNGEEKKIQNYLGISLIPQAGVAIGIAMTVQTKLPEVGSIVIAIVLSSVIVYELVGPYATKIALFLAGEIPKKVIDKERKTSFEF